MPTTIEIHDVPLRRLRALPTTRTKIYKRCFVLKHVKRIQLLIDTTSGECSVRIAVSTPCDLPHFVVRMSGSGLAVQTKGRLTPSLGTMKLWKTLANTDSHVKYTYYDITLPVYGEYFLDVIFLLCNMERGPSAANSPECVVPPACGPVNEFFNFRWTNELDSNKTTAPNQTSILRKCNDAELRKECPYWIKKTDVYPPRMLPHRYQSFDIPFDDPRQAYHWASSNFYNDYEFGFEFPSLLTLLNELSKRVSKRKTYKVCFFGDSFPLYISWPILRALTGADVNGNNVSDKRLENGKKHWSYISQVWPHDLSVKLMHIHNNIWDQPVKKMRDYRESKYNIAFAGCTHVFINFGQWNGAAVNKKVADPPEYLKEGVSRQIDLARAHSEADAKLFVFSLNIIPIKSHCPVIDWRTPVLLDEYNKALEILSKHKNVTYVDINEIANPMWDEPPDRTHFGPMRATILAKYLLWRALDKDIY
eukprot:Nk52_evm15s684 gene=Nk52_evmTU15s684